MAVALPAEIQVLSGEGVKYKGIRDLHSRKKTEFVEKGEQIMVAFNSDLMERFIRMEQKLDDLVTTVKELKDRVWQFFFAILAALFLATLAVIAKL